MTTQRARGKTTPASTSGSFAAHAHGVSSVDLAAEEPDWREQSLRVEGRIFTLGQVHGGRLFHGSPHPIEDGDLIEPGRAVANFKESAADRVSITSLASDALRWGREAAGVTGADAYVYEVEPTGYVEAWRSGLANAGQSFNLFEGRVAAARVVRRVPTEEARTYARMLYDRQVAAQQDGAARRRLPPGSHADQTTSVSGRRTASSPPTYEA